MISSNSNKILFIVCIALIFGSACRFWQSKKDNVNLQTSDSEINTNIPFSTKEPEVFQAEFVVSTFINGEKNERKYFVAKKGEKLLTKIGVGSEEEISLLTLAENESFVIEHSPKKIEKRSSADTSSDNSENDWEQFLTIKWLNEKSGAKFQKLATENNLTKYVVKLEDATNSEIWVFVDEKLKIPTKQEIYSVVGDKKTLTYSVEVKNYKTVVEDKLFELPKDYKEIN